MPGSPGPVNSGEVLPKGTTTGVPTAAATCIGPCIVSQDKVADAQSGTEFPQTGLACQVPDYLPFLYMSCQQSGLGLNGGGDARGQFPVCRPTQNDPATANTPVQFYGRRDGTALPASASPVRTPAPGVSPKRGRQRLEGSATVGSPEAVTKRLCIAIRNDQHRCAWYRLRSQRADQLQGSDRDDGYGKPQG